MRLIMTKQILQSALEMKSGWTLVKCIGVKETEAKGKDLTILEFEGVSGPEDSDENEGRLISHFIYHSAITGSKPVPSVVMDIINMFMAFEECNYDEAVEALKGQEINFSSWNGKQVYAEVFDDVWEGKIRKKIRNWRPTTVVPF